MDQNFSSQIADGFLASRRMRTCRWTWRWGLAFGIIFKTGPIVAISASLRTLPLPLRCVGRYT